MKRSREQAVGLVIIAISAALAVLGYLMLPEVMAVQIGLNGQVSNSLPKIPALLIPFAISTIAAIRYMTGGASGRAKNLLLAVVGLGIAVLGFVINYGR